MCRVTLAEVVFARAVGKSGAGATARQSLANMNSNKIFRIFATDLHVKNDKVRTTRFDDFPRSLRSAPIPPHTPVRATNRRGGNRNDRAEQSN